MQEAPGGPAARVDGASALVGHSSIMRGLRDRVRRLAAFGEPVLVLGETGTGKELVARALHAESPRGALRLQVIHCAGVGPEVLASELFGHARGAFTGATGDRAGRILTADGSTVVLDEISETSDAFQAAVLRAIEYGEIQPVGRDHSRDVDVRFVATSNRPLRELREGGALRADLFHRLAAFVLVVPPLRERREDIAALADHFLGRFATRYGTPRRLSRAAGEVLALQGFPGNVRELGQILVRAYVASEHEEIAAEEIAAALEVDDADEEAGVATPVSLECVIRRHIRRTLDATDGNLSQTARLLEVPRSTLQHYLVKYRVEAPAEVARRRTAT